MRIFIFLALLFLSFPALAGAVSPENQADLERIEAYLNSFKTLHAEFTQSSSNGNIADGELYLSRPNKMRFEYKGDKKLQLVADGKNLIYYDERLEQVSYLPLKSSPLYPILKDHVDLNDKSIRIVRFAKTESEISLGFVQSSDPGAGELTLQFSESPLELRRWVVRDAQDVMTTVSLIGVETDKTVDAKLFKFVDPRPYRSGGE